MQISVSRPVVLLRAEGATIASFCALIYSQTGASWWLAVALLLAPDLSMLGYLGGPSLGAATYNLFHTYTLPAILAAYAFVSGGTGTVAFALALIWTAHIAVDRLLGFGLKYPSSFKDTHLDRV